MGNKIYVSVESMNYWWGIYGLTGKVGWEDINLFVKNNHEYSKIAHTCICSRTYLENCLAELEEDIDEKEYTCEIKEFLNRNQTLFQYNYDKSENEDFYEVPFEAERNEKGIKPCYIETWHMSGSIDEAVIKECVVLFCKKFLNSSVDEVIFKDIVSVGEATNEYIEQCELFGGGLEMIFSDDLVKQLEVEWKRPREKVIEILNRSVK